jgi:hypothetical protein
VENKALNILWKKTIDCQGKISMHGFVVRSKRILGSDFYLNDAIEMIEGKIGTVNRRFAPQIEYIEGSLCTRFVYDKFRAYIIINCI